MNPSLEKFLTAKNPKAKLDAALSLLGRDTALPESCERYLRLRGCAAALTLTERGELSKLRLLLPLLDEAAIHRLLTEPSRLTAEARAILLRLPPSPASPADPAADLIRLWLLRIGMTYPALRRAVLALTLTTGRLGQPLETDGEKLYYDEALFTGAYAARRGYDDCVRLIMDYLHSGDHSSLPPDRAALWQLAAEGCGESFGNSHFGHAPGSREERLELKKAARYDFSGYLRHFTEIREERRLDPDSIDYIPYCYGLKTYKNLALVEPLEYRETAKIREMVIAIDTSGSCTAEHVAEFLAEIREILTGQADFFREMEVSILQCDAAIQEIRRITSAEEWMDYERHITVQGRGGTDFTPVFEWIGLEQSRGRLRNLKALLYFTDGDGIFPRNPPPYETALISPGRKILNYKTPDWCRIFCLDEKETIL